MRVALVQEQVDVRRGGAETSTLEMARRLGELGLDVTVVCAGGGETPGVRVQAIAAAGATKAARAWSFARGADALCRDAGFEIVHAISPCLSANVYQPRGGTYPETVARTLAVTRNPLLRGLKRVGRAFNARQRCLTHLERQLVCDADPPFVAAVSEYVKSQIASDYPAALGRTRVVFNGVDFEPLDSERAAAARRRARSETALGETPGVLFVAHNFRLKGLRELIAATALDSDWKVIVAGRDSPAPFERQAARAGLRKRVLFLGTRYSMPELYAAADVLAHPTWYDPCSRVVLEALLAGLPAVTTRFNGAAEVIDSRRGAVLDSPADVAGLAAAIRQALNAGRREVDAALAQELSMARHAEQLRRLYDEVLSAGRRPHV